MTTRIFNTTVSNATKGLKNLAVYLGGCLALVVAYNKFGKELSVKSNLIPFILCSIPLVISFIFHAFPLWIKLRKKKTIEKIGITGKINAPGYFRLRPYEEGEDFYREDNVHKNIYTWIKNSTESILFLSGESGTGKSSLLNSYILPKLKQDSYTIVPIRSFENFVDSIGKEIFQTNNVWETTSTKQGDIRSLLNKVCLKLDEMKLLIIFDQFEEFLILQDVEKQKELENLFFALNQKNTPNITSLISLRNEYLGQLSSISLPSLIQDKNWKTINKFTIPIAKDFINRSGLELGDELLNKILKEAQQLEGTDGLIRPIVLNMLGIIIQRFDKELPSNIEPGNLISYYLKETIYDNNIKEYSSEILSQMITTDGTKYPRTEIEISEKTGFEINVIKGFFFTLANKGLLRQIDIKKNVWEISHDFIANKIRGIFLVGKKPVLSTIRSWLPLLAFLIWGISFLVFKPSLALVSKPILNTNPIIELKKLEVQFSKTDSTYEFYYFEKDSQFIKSIKHLNKLDKKLDITLQFNTNSLTPKIGELTQVTTLSIINPGLEELPSEIGNLTNLSQLIIANTNLDILPPEVGNLTSLKTLDLIRSGLDELPREIGNLTNLTNLTIEENGFNKLPREIGNLTNLTNLTIEENGFNKLPREIGNLTNLTNLTIKEYELDEVPPEIWNLTNLTNLTIEGNGLNKLPSEIGNLINLKELHLSYNLLNTIPPEIGNLINLEKLDLSYNKLDTIPPEIWNLTNLKELDLSSNELDTIPLEIGNLTNLEYLDLTSNEWDEIPTEIRNLENLVDLL